MKILDKLHIEQPPTIREEVYKYLRRRILTGEIAPTERLIEVKLSDEIGTSRTPIREALHKLEMEKLVKSIPRVGYVVNEISKEEVEEFCEIRLALETLAAKWASTKITAKDLKRLERNILLADKHIKKNEMERVVELDTEFHDTICKASGSTRIEEMSQNFRDYMLRFRMKGLCVTEIAQRSNEGHQRILSAIKNRDMNGIEAAVSFHLNRTKKDLIELVS